MENLNKIIALTSDDPKPSRTTAKSGISSVDMVGSAEVVPMKPDEDMKKSGISSMDTCLALLKLCPWTSTVTRRCHSEG